MPHLRESTLLRSRATRYRLGRNADGIQDTRTYIYIYLRRFLPFDARLENIRDLKMYFGEIYFSLPDDYFSLKFIRDSLFLAALFSEELIY